MNTYTNCVVIWPRHNHQSGAAQHVVTFGSNYPLAKKSRARCGHDYAYDFGSLDGAQAALRTVRDEIGLRHQVERWTFAQIGGKRLWIGLLAPLEVNQ